MAARTAFFGTPSAAVPALAALAATTSVEVVVTRPDKPRGRSGTAQPPPIKAAAREWGIPIEQPARASEVVGLLAGLDLAVVVAYGQILPEDMLSVPAHGFVNIHFSRLPRWRGAAPVARAILEGDATTGVDLMQLDAGMDTGDIISRRQVDIGESDTTGSLTARLAALGAELLGQTLPAILAGSAPRTPQPADGVTIARKVTPAEGRLSPAVMSAAECDRVVRALNPNPGAWAVVDGERLKVWRSRARSTSRLEAGATELDGGRVVVGTMAGDWELDVVQAAGKARMPAPVWARGYRGAFHWE
jgi:methionyl-tRNA formyltransferase